MCDLTTRPALPSDLPRLAEIYNRIVAGGTLPNPGSVALHERFGSRHVGTFTQNGRKFGKYWDVAWFERPLKLGQLPSF